MWRIWTAATWSSWGWRRAMGPCWRGGIITQMCHRRWVNDVPELQFNCVTLQNRGCAIAISCVICGTYKTLHRASWAVCWECLIIKWESYLLARVSSIPPSLYFKKSDLLGDWRWSATWPFLTETYLMN